MNGLARVSTSKIYRVYTDRQYRDSYAEYDIPKKEFIDMYLDVVMDSNTDDLKLVKVRDLWNYDKRSICLDNEYIILIKSRNK